MHFSSSDATTPATLPFKTPRLVSLEHRLQHAQDPDGHAIDLSDDLLFFLDAPPPGTRDRWQEGADLCAQHGIQTSRMSVWRFYRAHILAWRRRQIGAPAPDPAETARLQEQARHLAAQRALEMLGDPNLTPGQLLGFLQGDNHRQKVQLARDQFNDQLKEKERLQLKAERQRIDDDARERAMPAHLEAMRKIFFGPRTIPPGNGTSPCPPPTRQKERPSPDRGEEAKSDARKVTQDGRLRGPASKLDSTPPGARKES